MKKGITIIEALQAGERILRDSRISSPRLDAEVLLAYILEKERAYLYINRDEPLSSEVLSLYNSYIKLRSEGRPVSYITATKEFMSLDFMVSPCVLIPRPETEILVENVIDAAEEMWTANRRDKPARDKYIKIVEIGTGSGAVAVSTAKYMDRCIVYATDIDQNALDIAVNNSIKHCVGERVVFLKGNLFEALQGKSGCGFMNSVDIIASNPPYIPSGSIKTLQKEIREYEPIGALDGGEDGLRFYRDITKEAPFFLRQGGILVFEVGFNQAEDVKKIIMNTGSFDKLEVYKDLAGIDRVVAAKTPLI